jgi:type IV pilus biogenesis protein PilP
MRSLNQILLLTLSLAAQAAFAQSPEQVEPVSTRAIREMSENSAILEARLREIKISNEIDEALAKKAERESSRVQKTARTLSSDVGTPTVVYVEGVKGRLEALLQFRGGARQRVRVGDSVHGAVVQKIALNDVVLYDTSAKTTVRLQFSEAADQLQPVAGQGLPSGFAPPVVIPQPLPMMR